jgi:hypothetical protein
MRVPAPHRGPTAWTLAAATALLAVCLAASANPLPEPTWTELAQLVPRFAEAPSSEAGDTLAYLLRVSPGAVAIRKNAQIVEANFDLFAPYLIEAHRPGVAWTIAPGVADLYLQMADRPQRDAMLEVLRSWLLTSAISPEVSAKYEQVAAVSVEDQVAVAEILSDAGDTVAIPAMRALQATIPKGSGAWVHLDQAVTRMSAALEAGFLVPTEESGVRLARGPEDATVMVAGRVVSESVAAGVFHELGKAESHSKTAMTRGGVIVRIEFADGLVGKLTWSEGSSFVYTDNARQNEHRRTRVGVRGWGLVAVIGEVLRANGMEDHPLAK